MLIQTVRCRIKVSKWTPSHRVRIGVLADLHNNFHPGLLSAIREGAPDFVVAVGDMVSENPVLGGVSWHRAVRLLKEIAKERPVYYAPGNHEDRWARQSGIAAQEYLEFRSRLAEAGIFYLENAFVDLDADGARLRLSGLSLPPDCYGRVSRIPKSVSQKTLRKLLGPCACERPDTLQILLAHSPRYFKDYAAWGAELTLSGHLHGGTVRLPRIGGLIGPGPELFPAYSKGLFEDKGRKMIVSAGLGTHTVPFRLFNPREYLLVTLEGSGKEEQR